METIILTRRRLMLGQLINGQFFVLFARMVCALFSSFWQCQKRNDKIGSKRIFHGARLKEGGGSKAICPTNTFQKGATLTTLILLLFINYWVQKGVCFNWTSIHLFHQRVLHSGVLCTAEITFLLLNGILSLCFEFQLFVVVLSIYVYLMEPYTRIKKFSPYLVAS